MNLQFLGAAREVTGSCYLLQADNLSILIDCGMEQGEDIYQNIELPISAGEIDYVLLSHAHIDHSGNLPLLVSKGFKGKIISTLATYRLCDIMLKDSAHIQEFEAQWKNRKAERSGGKIYEPSYTLQDAMAALALFVPIQYEQVFKLSDNISIRFRDVGHLLGSASIEISLVENDKKTIVVFSGDIGNTQQPIIKDPSYFDYADFVIMESTYGDRSHGLRPDYIKELSDVIQTTLDKGGNVVIPSFAVGRTQEILYFIREIKEKSLVKNHDNFPVYVDSPLAVEATNIFKDSDLDYFDQEMKELILKGINPISFKDLHLSLSSEESKQINFDTTPKIIISASGMCNAGRIRHHLKHNLWRHSSCILFVGYQSIGTLGRTILDGARQVKLFGETIEVNAQIRTLNAISGHADNNGLIKWATSFKNKPKKYFICHGEENVALEFANRLIQEYNLNAHVPYNGEKWDLNTQSIVQEGNKNYIEHKDISNKVKQNTLYQELLNSTQELADLVANSSGLSNYLIKQLRKQIDDIVNYWKN